MLLHSSFTVSDGFLIGGILEWKSAAVVIKLIWVFKQWAGEEYASTGYFMHLGIVCVNGETVQRSFTTSPVVPIVYFNVNIIEVEMVYSDLF